MDVSRIPAGWTWPASPSFGSPEAALWPCPSERCTVGPADLFAVLPVALFWQAATLWACWGRRDELKQWSSGIMSLIHTHTADIGEHESCSNDPGFEANRELGGMPNSLLGCVGGNARPVGVGAEGPARKNGGICLLYPS